MIEWQRALKLSSISVNFQLLQVPSGSSIFYRRKLFLRWNVISSYSTIMYLQLSNGEESDMGESNTDVREQASFTERLGRMDWCR